jgi:hypothetical protein
VASPSPIPTTVGPFDLDSPMVSTAAVALSCLLQATAGKEESSLDSITDAIVAGAAAGLTSTASQAVRDAYERLKALLGRRFPWIGVRLVEELPNSSAKQVHSYVPLTSLPSLPPMPNWRSSPCSRSLSLRAASGDDLALPARPHRIGDRRPLQVRPAYGSPLDRPLQP